ncbi:MAG: pyridoxamine 5'-phosphate oxidase family protein [Firmicutes bacterium]|nr:pyridoxamine 5'-phosphate oxidase family protein [Bacillota bacterium]
MNREMYKKDRQTSPEATIEMVKRGDHATLSVIGDDGYPYGTPTNYIYMDGAFYLHAAKYGYKIDALKENNKVCLSAIVSAEVLPSKFTAAYESFVAFGKAVFVEDEDEKRKALQGFIDHFSADFQEGGAKFIKAAFEKTQVIRIDVEELKGKEYKDGPWKK